MIESFSYPEYNEVDYPWWNKDTKREYLERVPETDEEKAERLNRQVKRLDDFFSMYTDEYFKFSFIFPNEWSDHIGIYTLAMGGVSKGYPPPPYAYSIIEFVFNNEPEKNRISFSAIPETPGFETGTKYGEYIADDNKKINMWGKEDDERVYLKFKCEDRRYGGIIDMDIELFEKNKSQILDAIKSFKYLDEKYPWKNE